MSAFKAVIAAVVLAASVGTPLALLHSGEAKTQEKREALRLQAGRLAELTAENQRLSNLVVQAEGPALSADQFRELLRLRGEIKSLRQAAGEAAQLRALDQRDPAQP